MDNSLGSNELAAWNAFVKARTARHEAKDKENLAYDNYMHAMDLSLEAIKREHTAFDAWMQATKRIRTVLWRKRHKTTAPLTPACMFSVCSIYIDLAL
jgi:hypothetical protein